MSATWAMGKALSELMARHHGRTSAAPAPVAGSLFCASWRIFRRLEIERRGLGSCCIGPSGGLSFSLALND
jgi:hypothetical protein